jgi:hypothetical protein
MKKGCDSNANEIIVITELDEKTLLFFGAY